MRVDARSSVLGILAVLVFAFLPGSSPGTAAADPPSDTDWFRDARYGVFMHFLPSDTKGFALVDDFDVEALAAQLESIGARYFTITLGQNSGFLISPNAAYDRVTGYGPGERCSRRDLPLDLHRALAPRGIRLMLYLPAQTPNRDRRAQKAFGLAEGPLDQPIDLEFARKWAEVIREWSDRYGEKVSGWWFDGCYDHVKFGEEIAEVYAEAAKHGNPRSIVAFNPGVKVVRHARAEDYTAGELNEPFDTIPAARRLDGAQWHALTYLGSSWSARDTREPSERWAAWSKAVVAREGVVTLDMGPNWDPKAGPIGALAPAQVEQVLAIRAALGPSVPRTADSAVGLPKRLTRAESFLGIHFDFHAGTDCTNIGANTTREMIESVIDQVHPDYIQTDCKGHPGLSSYPTKVGNPAPGFVGDPLALWRQVTAERGVALFMHYSGVWDSEAIRQNPDWAVIDANGKPNGNATSFFSPYADRLLVPQLRELSGTYGVDGAWVDGECWASVPDYGEDALEVWRKAGGAAEAPRKPGDPGWHEFLQFHRERFRVYLRHYIAEVKKTNPEMQLCSNWAFTDHMPEPVSAPVDWISGDYSPEDSLNSARFSARYMARQGKPWDLMAWSFARVPGQDGWHPKTAVQLQREAAAVLSLGGGFQAYFTQRRDASIRLEQIPVMAQVAEFCRARQAACHRALPIPQVALLYSTASHYRESNGLFPRDLSRIRGTLQALLEAQWSVDVVGEHHLAGRMAEYPLIVIPECEFLEPDFRRELLAHVEVGGRVLVIGPRAAEPFAAELGNEPGRRAAFEPRVLDHSGARVSIKGEARAVELAPKARAFGRLRATLEGDSPSAPAASIANVGRGEIAATYFHFSEGYLTDRSEVSRAFLSDLVRQLFPRPMVEVKGSPDVDVSVLENAGRLAVNLVNTSGPHATRSIQEAIPEVGPLEITIRLAKAPERITLEPGGASLPFEFRDGETHLTLPRLDIHSVLLVTP